MDNEIEIGKPLDFEFYNKKKTEILSVIEGYNKWSKNYNELDNSFDIDLLNSSKYIKNKISNKTIIDIGCGTGRIGKWVNDFSPQKITGLDQNNEMINIAHNENIYNDIILSSLFEHDFKKQNFDGIITSLMLCHIEDISLFYKTISNIIREKGWLCIIDYHPYMLLNGIPTKFQDKDTSIPYSIKNYIHSLSDHFSYANENNLKLIEFKERYVTDSWISKTKSIEKYKGNPISFMMLFENEK